MDETADLEEGEEDNSATSKLTVQGGLMCNNYSTIATSAVYDYGGPNQTNGFITCGHGWSVGDSVMIGNVFLGTVMSRQQGGNVDYSFIKSSYNSNGYMINGDRLTGRQNPTCNMPVKCYAGVSGIQTGTVTDIKISGEWSGIDFDDLFSTTIPTAKRDSGSAFASGSDIVGIMKGGLGGYEISVGVKIENIANNNVLPSR